MAKDKFKNEFASISVREFDGIDRRRLIGDAKGALKIENFRILADGSLEKRCGYRLSLTMSSNIRAIWSGELEGSSALVALSGSTVYLVNPNSGVFIAKGYVGTSVGSACFFMLGGKLYLLDGADVYAFTRTSVYLVNGYVPLYGKDWIHTGGDINEPINQLSTHIRITYKLTASSASSVYIGIPAVAVDSLIINGTPKTSGYSISGTTLNLGTTCSLNSVIEVCLDIGSAFAERSALGGCTGAAVYGGKYDTSVYCFGGSDKSRVFRSRYVSAADVSASTATIAGSSGLYFPVGYDFAAASGGGEVTAVCRHYDRLLIFTADDARMSDLAEDDFQDIPVRPVNSGVGCHMADGVVLCGNDPLTVSRDGVYRWTANTDERDESSAVNISFPVDDLLNRNFRIGAVAFNYREKEEIWIGNPADTEGRVFIYNYQLGKWYYFTGIAGERYFTYEGSIGFCKGRNLYIFSESEYTDLTYEISASFLSRFSDMGQEGISKRIKRCHMVLSAGSEVSLTLADTKNDMAAVAFNSDTIRIGSDSETGDIDCHEVRVYTGRFDYVGYRIEAGGASRQRIYRIALIAGK